MTVENISQFYGIALSLLLAYLPVLSTWYNALGSTQKSQVMLGGIFGGLAVVFALSCFGLPLFGVACTVASAFELVKLLIQVAIANQASYFLLVRPFKN